jgi:hypothetical protein
MQGENFEEGATGGIAPAKEKNLHDQRRRVPEVNVYDHVKNLGRAQHAVPYKERRRRTGKGACAININQNWRTMMPAAIGDVS